MTESQLIEHLVAVLTERWVVLKSPRTLAEALLGDPTLRVLLDLDPESATP